MNHTTKISIGSKIRLKIDDEEKEYKIIDGQTPNPAQGLISPFSPVGQMLLGKSAGEEVAIKLPNSRTVIYKILGIKQ